MHRIPHLNPDYVSERLAAVEDVGRSWAMSGLIVAALLLGLSVLR
jgi:hypothetical protein